MPQLLFCRCAMPWLYWCDIFLSSPLLKVQGLVWVYAAPAKGSTESLGAPVAMWGLGLGAVPFPAMVIHM